MIVNSGKRKRKIYENSFLLRILSPGIDDTLAEQLIHIFYIEPRISYIELGMWQYSFIRIHVERPSACFIVVFAYRIVNFLIEVCK